VIEYLIRYFFTFYQESTHAATETVTEGVYRVVYTGLLPLVIGAPTLPTYLVDTPFIFIWES